MIDLVEKFSKIEKPLTDLLNGQKEDYFGHNVSKNLNNRIEALKKSNNMDFGTGFESGLRFPIQKGVSMMRKFIFDQNFREQLYYVKQSESTDLDTAKNIEDTLSDNLRRTKFRATTFNRIKQNLSEYGAAVSYSTPGILRQPHLKTKPIKDQDGNLIRTERVRVDAPDIVVFNKNINPMYYFQDPDCPFPEESMWKGHIDRWDIPEFVAYAMQNKDYLIKKNINTIMDGLKEAGSIDNFYQRNEKSLSKYPVDVTIMYSTANIKGNEENLIPYYFEMVNGKIIRIEKDLFDENLVPYTIYTFMPIMDAWWGNCDGELQLPHENAINTLIPMKFRNAIQALDQTILASKGIIDPVDFQNRRYNGGIVEVDLPDGMRITDVFNKVQNTDDALSTFDAIMREVNSNRQALSSQPNVNQRVSKTSPLANTTATAVGAMQEQGDIKEGSYNEQFNYGIIRLGMINITLMQQFFPDYFSVVSSPGKEERFLSKEDILGNAEVTIRTALTNNKAHEAQRYLNAINHILNWRGTQDPAMMNIQLEQIVKTALHRLDIGDINDIYQENQQIPQQIPQQEVPVAA